jgi:predicted transcriptional regulator
MVLSTEERALTPAQVRQAIGGDLAYTTVMTVLTRLYDKGLVARERSGRAFAYRWVPADADLAARRMGQALEQVDDHAAVLARFVDELSPADGALLVDLLRRIPPGQP